MVLEKWMRVVRMKGRLSTEINDEAQRQDLGTYLAIVNAIQVISQLNEKEIKFQVRHRYVIFPEDELTKDAKELRKITIQ